MATYTKTVDPNGGADYASLALWEAGEQTLYSSGDIAIADCRRTGVLKDTNAVTVSGWTSGVEPHIIVNEAHRHEGKWAENRDADGNYVYILSVAPPGYAAIDVSVPNTKILGLSCELVSDGTNGFFDGGVNRVIDSCIIKGTNKDAANTIGVYLSSNNQIVLNTIIYNLRSGVWSQWGGSNIKIHNTTVFGCGATGVNIYQSTEVVNTISVGNTVASFHNQGTSGGHNISSDGTAPGANSLINQAATDIFVDPANGDFRLKAGSPAIGSGADLSAFFTTDITGATRTVPWDIGAFMHVAAGLTAPTLTAPENMATGVALRPTFTWS